MSITYVNLKVPNWNVESVSVRSSSEAEGEIVLIRSTRRNERPSSVRSSKK